MLKEEHAYAENVFPCVLFILAPMESVSALHSSRFHDQQSDAANKLAGFKTCVVIITSKENGKIRVDSDQPDLLLRLGRLRSAQKR